MSESLIRLSIKYLKYALRHEHGYALGRIVERVILMLEVCIDPREA